jgi:hypothetical protein
MIMHLPPRPPRHPLHLCLTEALHSNGTRGAEKPHAARAALRRHCLHSAEVEEVVLEDPSQLRVPEGNHVRNLPPAANIRRAAAAAATMLTLNQAR